VVDEVNDVVLDLEWIDRDEAKIYSNKNSNVFFFLLHFTFDNLMNNYLLSKELELDFDMMVIDFHQMIVVVYYYYVLIDVVVDNWVILYDYHHDDE
jgi:hypothetical protein